MQTFFLCLLLLALLGCSAFFAASETAFLSLTNVKIRQIVKEHLKNVKYISKLKKNINELLSTVAIGTNFVMAASSSIATAFAISLLGRNGTGIATSIMAILIILFGEILPKTIAAYFPLKVAQLTAPALHFLEFLFYPLVWFFTKLTGCITFLLNKIWLTESQQITEDELKTLIEVGDKEGILEHGEKEMLGKIFEFSDLRAKNLQKHRSLIKSLDINATYNESVAFISNCGFSRIPVYKEKTSNIVGLIHFKDILFFTGNKEMFSLEKIMHPILFVPETKPALDLLYFFKTQRQHFAVVVDEHGSISGIVTMDDILKAVFGRVTDEYNTHLIPAEDRITVVSPREFRIPGDILLSDLNGFFSLKLNSENCNTIGGWLIEQFGYLPDVSETLHYNGILFRVEDQSQRRIQDISMIFAKDKTK
jgi:putative hemolysin